MRPFSQQYTEVPAEEKPDEDREGSTGETARWGRKSTAWAISAVLLTSLLVLLIGIGGLVMRKPPQVVPSEKSSGEWLAHASRAAGDQYLLGVGKADITG